jgi:hypothetical protein
MKANRPFQDQILVDASYIRSLREECKTYRLAKNAAEAHAKALLTQLEKRLVEAEMKVALIEAGCIDLDWWVFLDFGNVRLLEDGTLAGAQESIDAMKLHKPHVFKTGATTAPFTTARGESSGHFNEVTP